MSKMTVTLKSIKKVAYVVLPDPIGPRIALTPGPINPLLRKTNKFFIKDANFQYQLDKFLLQLQY